MRFFFRSKQFRRILIIVAAVLLTVAVTLAAAGAASPSSNIFGAVAEPVQAAFHKVVNSVGGFFSSIGANQRLQRENQRLKEEVDRLTGEVASGEEALRENEFYKNYLGLKEEHPDFTFQHASVISRDKGDVCGGFVLNRGSLDSVSLHDPVITDAGLVGYVSEVALTYSKVTTLLSSAIKVGAKDVRTGDVGVVSGGAGYAKDGRTAMSGLPRSCSLTVGDRLATNGGGIFPEGLLIGTVERVRSSGTDISVYAVVKPAADPGELSEVMIITSFTGQGESYSPEAGE